jgi:protein-S-isoprenylcysteine O-methyltransferase Ste14
LFRWRGHLYLLFVACIVWGAIESPLADVGVRERRTWHLASLALALAGVVWRVYTVGHVAPGTSGRSTKAPRGESLNTTGAYSVMRHPLYVGNYLVVLGCVSATAAWWPVVVASTLYWILHGPIVAAEEEYLRSRFGLTFDEWAGRTPAFLPGLRLWRAPALPFAFRVALRREYRSLPVVVTSMAFVDVTTRVASGQGLSVDPLWTGLLLFSLAFHVTVRALLKTSTLLDRR